MNLSVTLGHMVSSTNNYECVSAPISFKTLLLSAKKTPTRTSLTEMTENGYYEDFVIGTILTRSAEKMAVTQTLAHGMNYHV